MSSASDYAQLVSAFVQELGKLGYRQDKNLAIEYRWANGREERLRELAAELVRLKPDVLVTHATGVHAAQESTSTIPIVMGASADPVGFGLIKSLAKPGGNTTGVASQIVDLSSKRLELLMEVVPNLKYVAVLSNMANPGTRKGLQEMEIAAAKIGVRIRPFAVSAQPGSLESAFDALLRERPDGLIVQPDPLTGTLSTRIVALASKNGLPAIGGVRQFAVDGGLMSYGANFADGWRLAARYVDRILKGANPADMPVEQPSVFELTINTKTARALGLTLPASLRLRADPLI